MRRDKNRLDSSLLSESHLLHWPCQNVAMLPLLRLRVGVAWVKDATITP